MDGNRQIPEFQNYEVQNMHEKEFELSVNGDVVPFTNGYSRKAADDGSGSENGYTTPKKRWAKRSSVKGPDKVSKACSKLDAQTSSQELGGKAASARPNCTRTCLKTEVHPPDGQDTALVGEAACRIPDSKPSGLVSKKTEDRVGKAKPISSATSKEDSWTLFKPPPVFPVDNSSAKIVPKISYASKVKENLNKVTGQASVEVPQVPLKHSQVPMSAVKTCLPLDANGCPSVETSFNSAASTPPSAVSNPDQEDVASVLDNSGSSSSAPEPRKSSLFVYPHKPLNMQPVPSAAQTNQNALGDIFQNQWGLSFINEPNAGPEGAAVSRTGARLNISDVTFQGEGLPFVGQPGLDSTSAVSLPEPQAVKGRTSGTDGASNPCSTYHTASQDCPQPQNADQAQKENTSPELSCEELDAEPLGNRSFGASKAQSYRKDQDGQGWADLRAAVLYHTKEFGLILALQKQDPNRVLYYTKEMDGPDH